MLFQGGFLMNLVTGQFSESFPPIMDGVGNVAKNYAYWLNKKYGTGYVVTPDYPRYVDNTDFRVLRYNSVGVITRYPYRTGIPNLDPVFMRAVRKVPFDIVHAHTPFSSGRIALDTARKRNIPIIASFHSKYYDDFLESFKLERIARFGVSKIIEFYNSVDAVWTVNNSTAKTLREYGFKGPIEVMQNGIEYEPPENKASDRMMVNRKLKLNESELVFIYVGQMVWQKNTRVLLESLSILKNKGLDFKMLMVGEGYALGELKTLAKELGIGNSVLFLGNIEDRDYLRTLYCRADFLLFPSLYDTFSLVVREAASQGCPALLIEDSNAAEGVTDEVNGILTENGPENIAARVLKVLETPGLLKKVGENANKSLYVNWETVVDRVYKRYLEIVRTYKRVHACN
jgi:glycosyltransferase involved in cell wall biosynthesis